MSDESIPDEERQETPLLSTRANMERVETDIHYGYEVTGRRIVAAGIDCVPLIIVFILLALRTGSVVTTGNSYQAELNGWQLLHFFGLVLAYFVLSEGLAGVTLGKKLMGLKVVVLDGRPFGGIAVLIRNLLRIVDALPLFYFIGILIVSITKRGQRLGDLVARTQVVRDNYPIDLPGSCGDDSSKSAAASKQGLSTAAKLSLALFCFALVSGIAIFASPERATGNRPMHRYTPSDDDLRRITIDTLLEFDRAVKSWDFTTFHAHAAELWKSETTADQIAKVFQSFRDNKVSLVGVKDATPVFEKPPSVSDDGVLTLSGYVPTEMWLVRFSLKFTYEHPAWKLIAIRVKVND